MLTESWLLVWLTPDWHKPISAKKEICICAISPLTGIKASLWQITVGKWTLGAGNLYFLWEVSCHTSSNALCVRDSALMCGNGKVQLDVGVYIKDKQYKKAFMEKVQCKKAGWWPLSHGTGTRAIYSQEIIMKRLPINCWHYCIGVSWRQIHRNVEDQGTNKWKMM